MASFVEDREIEPGFLPRHRSGAFGAALLFFALAAGGGCPINVGIGSGGEDDPIPPDDGEPPAVVDLVGPASPSTEMTASFTFRCSKEDCSFLCRLSPEEYEACESGVTYGPLADGDHHFEVLASDPAGNESDPESWMWTIDTSPLSVTEIQGPPPATNSTTAIFDFDCSGRDCSFTCSLTGDVQGTVFDTEACESGVEYTDLADDFYTFSLEARDALDRQAEATWLWEVDTVPPIVEIVSGPGPEHPYPFATFVFHCLDEDCTFECALDYDGERGHHEGGFEPCESPFQLRGLVTGSYILYVRGTDRAGNHDLASHAWTAVVDVPRCISASVGDSHTCGVWSDGGLWCWGANGHNQIGDGTSSTQISPVALSPNADWVQVAAGGGHGCALEHHGDLWCWGTNSTGQVGDASMVTRSSPVLVSTAGWAQVSAGNAHSCAVRAEGSLWCWGFNMYGQVGDGTNSTRVGPVQVGSSDEWAQVSAGFNHTCATKTDGSLWCWGYNHSGRLGDGTTSNRWFPIRVGSDTDWEEVSTGTAHTCATKQDGSLWCWGANVEGRLGDGTTETRTTPARIGSSTDWAQVSAGHDHSCAAKVDGTLWCWGANGSGQLGDGTSAPRHSPVQVGSDTDWMEAVTGGHSCAMKAGGSLWCWGANGSGQLGDGTRTARQSPVPVAGCMAGDCP